MAFFRIAAMAHVRRSGPLQALVADQARSEPPAAGICREALIAGTGRRVDLEENLAPFLTSVLHTAHRVIRNVFDHCL